MRRVRSSARSVIYLRAEAPVKPPTGAACNGCGACCALEPCPLGVLVSQRRHGRCRALRWDGPLGLYRCGMVSAPKNVLRWLPDAAVPAVRWLARRWISSASGCDAELAAEAPGAHHA